MTFSTALPAIFSNTQKTERGFQMDNTNPAKSVSATSENNSVKKECSYNLMHTLFAILSLVMGILYYNFVIKAFFGEYPQYLICIFTVVFCIFVWAYFYSQKKYITEQTLFFMAFTVAFSLRFAFYENTFDSLCFLSLFCVHIFALLSVLSASESLQMPILDNIVSGTLRAMGAPYTKYFSLFGSFSALFHIKSEKVEKWKKSNAGNIGLIFVGLVISIPLALTGLDYKGTAKDHTDLKKALSKKKRPKQTEKKLEEADTMQGMEEHAKETIINILEEITEDAVPVKKKKNAIIRTEKSS